MALRLITYNIRKGLGASGRDNMTLALGRELSSQAFDLVMCQEVFHDHDGEHHQSDMLGSALKMQPYYGANKHRPVGHHGNATFTSAIVDHVQNYDVSTNRFERRGVLYTRLMIEGKPLHVLNAHLGLNHRQRMAQMRQIGAILQWNCPKHEPVILAGDFNDWSQKLDGLIIKELGFENAFAHVDWSKIRTWHSKRPVFNLDRIYLRRLKRLDAQCLSGEPWPDLSDHLPLFVELGLV